MTTATKTDAIALLKADHKKVKKLFDDFEKTEDESKQEEIAVEACKELRIHSAIEEELFYPEVRAAFKKEEQEELMDEAEEEHRVAKTLIEEISEGGADTEHFCAKFMVLAENVRHHIKEEEGELFPNAQKTKLDFDDLGSRMLARKEELQASDVALDEAEEHSHVKSYQELHA
jgi:hemerythrin superfamily protein